MRLLPRTWRSVLIVVQNATSKLLFTGSERWRRAGVCCAGLNPDTGTCCEDDPAFDGGFGNCSTYEAGGVNEGYCEEDEAKLNPAGRVLGCEQSPSSPLIVIDYANNTDTLFNLTASSPSKSPRRAAYRPSLGSSASQGGDDNAVSDGVVSLSPFRSVIASKERVNRLITNIFELENDRLR